MSTPLDSLFIQVPCARPACPEWTLLPALALPLIAREAGVVARDDKAGVVQSEMMVGADGWCFGVTDGGVLYAACPADASALAQGYPGGLDDLPKGTPA